MCRAATSERAPLGLGFRHPAAASGFRLGELDKPAPGLGWGVLDGLALRLRVGVLGGLASGLGCSVLDVLPSGLGFGNRAGGARMALNTLCRLQPRTYCFRESAEACGREAAGTSVEGAQA